MMMPVDNLVGKRVYNHGLDEAATIVDIMDVEGEPMYVILQYDDGMDWDEAIADEPFAEEAGWAEGGLLSETYELIGPGPTLREGCEEHDWYPSPDALWDSYEAMKTEVYTNITRCKKCGLSGSTVINHGLGQSPPSLCARCDGVTPEADYWVPGYKDLPLCEECADEISE